MSDLASHNAQPSAPGDQGPYRNKPQGSTEVDRLLALADDMQEKREATLELIRSREIQSTRLVGGGLLISLGIGVYFWVTKDLLTGFGAYCAAFIGFIILFVVVSPHVIVSPNTATLKIRLRRDERALFDVIQILRESQASIAEEEKWSPLQQAEFRIRLARFDIGSSVKE